MEDLRGFVRARTTGSVAACMIGIFFSTVIMVRRGRAVPYCSMRNAALPIEVL